MSRKRRKNKKNSLPLHTNDGMKLIHVVYTGPTFCGFPLNVKRVNQLWNWNTLEDVKF